jgi:predicted transcriptional regulator
MAVKLPTYEDVLASLQECVNATPESVDGAHTICEWSVIWGICRANASQAIRKLAEQGLIEQVKLVRTRMNGSPYTMVAYRILEKKPAKKAKANA